MGERWINSNTSGHRGVGRGIQQTAPGVIIGQRPFLTSAQSVLYINGTFKLINVKFTYDESPWHILRVD